MLKHAFKEWAVMGVVVFVIHGRGKKGVPIAKGQKEFLIVVARVVAVIDIDEAELAGVRALV